MSTAIVAHRPAHGFHDTLQRSVADELAWPHLLTELLLRDNPLTVRQEIVEQLEDFCTQRDRLATLVQDIQLRIQRTITNNGTDAVEGARKLARLYTGKPGFISCLNGFHGKSYGSLSLMGKAAYRVPFEPLLRDVFFVPFGDADEVECEIEKAEAVGMGIAAVIAEPIRAEAGAIVPSSDYWPCLRDICDRKGVLLIADEVQTCLGRTGKLFAVDHWNTTPDIMCLGKALGAGVMPLSAFMSTPKIWSVLEKNSFIHSSTFGGNPLACAEY